MPKLTRGSRCDHRKHPGKEPRSTPTTKPRVDRAPRAKLLWKVAPRDTRSQDVEYRGEHKPVVFRGSPTQRPPASFSTRTVNFFSLRHNGSGSSLRRISFMRQMGLTRSAFVPSVCAPRGNRWHKTRPCRLRPRVPKFAYADWLAHSSMSWPKAATLYGTWFGILRFSDTDGAPRERERAGICGCRPWEIF